MSPRYEKCPKCESATLVYDPVKQTAYCRSSVCDFKEEVRDKIRFDQKFG